jgi:DNA-binding PucR family transcriptional regulator
MYFDEFDLGTFIVSEIPSERLAPKVDEIASLLRANPAIHEALQAYFAHHLDIAAAAASLYMHRNSLRYRLARAEQLLGRSLKDPSAIAAVYIALVAEQADRGLCRVTNPLG